jgi:hypothetical protein
MVISHAYRVVLQFGFQSLVGLLVPLLLLSRVSIPPRKVCGWAKPLFYKDPAAKEALDAMKAAQKELAQLEQDLENARALKATVDNSLSASQDFNKLIENALEALAVMDCKFVCRIT